MHISKKSCTFASELENNRENMFYILTIKFNSQITFFNNTTKIMPL